MSIFIRIASPIIIVISLFCILYRMSEESSEELLIIPLYICFETTIVTAKVAVMETMIRERQRPMDIFLFTAVLLLYKPNRGCRVRTQQSLWIFKYYGFET